MVPKITWEEYLHQTTGEEISKKPIKPIVVTYTSHRFEQLIEILLKNNILSVPVLEEGSELFLGFVDVYDIISYIQKEWENLSKESEEYLLDTNAMTKIFGKNPGLTQIADFSIWDYPVALSGNASVAQIIDKLCASSKMRAHRILMTQDLKPFNIISKSDIVSFAYGHLDALELQYPELVTSTVYHLGLVHACLNLRFTINLSDVLTEMFENRVSEVALVDSDSKLVAHFSTRDLKGLLVPQAFEFFHYPVLEFLAINENVSYPVNCGVGATLRQVLHHFVNQHLHSIYIVDKNQHLMGVISLTNVILLLKRLCFQTSN